MTPEVPDFARAIPTTQQQRRTSDMRLKQSARVAAVVLAIACAAGLIVNTVAKAQSRGQSGAAPIYKVDPFWPKPLPNKWIMQGVPTMVTDKDDHIWVLNRPRDINPDEAGAATNPPRTDCCTAAPAV